jgi:hypothetical protein
MQILSQAFEEGQDGGLATALSRTKAVGIAQLPGNSALTLPSSTFSELQKDASNHSITYAHFEVLSCFVLPKLNYAQFECTADAGSVEQRWLPSSLSL